jgi:hypothetical protein
VLGNSIISASADIQAALTMVPRGEATAAVTFSVVATASLGMFNGSFGLWSVEYDMDAAATMGWGGNGFYHGAFDMDAAAGASVAAGAAVVDGTFDMNAESAMTGVAGFIIQGAAVAALTWAGESEATSTFDVDSAALLSVTGNGLYPAAFDADAVADFEGYTQLPSEFDFDAVASVTFSGESEATSTFDMDAVATFNPVFSEIWTIDIVADLSWSSESEASAAFDSDAAFEPTWIAEADGNWSATAAASVAMVGAEIQVVDSDFAGTPGKGYFAGGFASTYSAEIDGIQFSDESAINPAAALATARQQLASANSTAKGYFGGGIISIASDEIDGIQFSDESAINPAATLAVARNGLAGVSSTVAGYFGGGTTGSNSDEIDGIQFSDEAAVNPSATLATARESLAGTQSQSTAAAATLTMVGDTA